MGGNFGSLVNGVFQSKRQPNQQSIVNRGAAESGNEWTLKVESMDERVTGMMERNAGKNM